MKEEANWVDTLFNIKIDGLYAYLNYGVRRGFIDDYNEALDYLESEILKWLETEEMYEDAHYIKTQAKIARDTYNEKIRL